MTPAQPEGIPSHPITSYLGKEANSQLTTASFLVVIGSNEVTPEPPLLQSEASQVPQLLPHSFVAQLWTHSRVSMSFL